MVKRRKGSRAGQRYAVGSKVRSSRRRLAAEKAGVASSRRAIDPAIQKALKTGATPQHTFEAMGFTVDPNAAVAPRAAFENVQDPAMLQAREILVDRAARGERERPNHASEGEVRVLSALIEKHGNNYKAMARDSRNSLQHSPKVLRRKCERLRQKAQ